MCLSDLPPLEGEFDKSLLEEGNHVFSPSKRKIDIRLPSSGVVIKSRSN